MGMITCEKCGSQNDAKKYFCQKCGKFLLAADFSDKGISADAELKLSRIAANLKENPHVDILWNDTIDAYTRKVERIQSLLRVKDAGIESSELTGKIDHFLNLCRTPDFEIAFVGAVKAGKSTLINALLGRNYASTDPNPETAVLTKFRSSEQDYLDIEFYSEREWNKLWKSIEADIARIIKSYKINGIKDVLTNYMNSDMDAFIKKYRNINPSAIKDLYEEIDTNKFLRLYKNLKAENQKKDWVNHPKMKINVENNEVEEELKKWSSSQSATHFFVKKIEVGISSLPAEFPKQIVFVDTPGLFDPVAFRSQISVDYIHSANAVLVCVKARDLHGEEVKTVESVFSFSGHKKNKVFIVATNWDELENVVLDWKKRYSYLVDAFTGKAFFPNSDMAKKNIMYADAYHYNLCRDYNVLEKTKKKKVSIWTLEIQNNIDECIEQEVAVPPSIQAISDIEVGMLSPSDLSKIMKLTNIKTVNDVIVNELINQYNELLYSDIKNLYEDIQHMVGRMAGDRKKSTDEKITISYADMKEIEQKLEEKKKNRDEIQKVQKQLTANLKILNKSTQQRLENVQQRLETIVSELR